MGEVVLSPELVQLLLQFGFGGILLLVLWQVGKGTQGLVLKLTDRLILSLDKFDVSIDKLASVIAIQDVNAEKRHGELRLWIEDRLKVTRHDVADGVTEAIIRESTQSHVKLQAMEARLTAILRQEKA